MTNTFINIHFQACLRCIRVSRPTVPQMLEEVLTNHEKNEVVSNRLEGIGVDIYNH